MRYTAVVLAMLAAGCLTSSQPPIVRYTLDPDTAVNEAPATDRAIGIRTIGAARPYRQKIAFLTEGSVLGQYEYAEWAELPEDLVTRALSDALVATNRFADVGQSSDVMRPDLMLTGELRKFHENRTVSPRTAQFEVRLELREGVERELVWGATLSAEVPLAKDDVSALPAAMNEAVSQVVREAAEQMAKL
jgi:ABC-type uncharacterized transport system auxiliary subunit